MKKTVWVADFVDKWIKEIDYSESYHCPYRIYDKYETREECVKDMISYYEDMVRDSKIELKEVKKLFKP